MEAGVDYLGIAVVFFCHDGTGKYLLARRSENSRDEAGKWDPGGGKVEYGENIEDALRREVREEYRAKILDYKYLGYRDVHRNEGGLETHWLAHDFKVLIGRDVTNGEPHKHDRIDWFELSNLPSPLHSEFRRCLELYKIAFTV